jgi:hypothetical protein
VYPYVSIYMYIYIIYYVTRDVLLFSTTDDDVHIIARGRTAAKRTVWIRPLANRLHLRIIILHSTCNGITHYYYYYYYYRHPSCQPVVLFDSVDVSYNARCEWHIFNANIYYICTQISHWRTYRTIICVILRPQWMNIISCMLYIYIYIWQRKRL